VNIVKGLRLDVPIKGRKMWYPTTLLILIDLLNPTSGHMRWTCPKPRNPDTGIKVGPCGSETDQFLSNATLVVSPGPFTVQWEESITHVGAPFRIALSPDGRDSDSSISKSCVLLDHIPHNDETAPRYLNESTYELYSLTIQIPDVSCMRCSLQIVNPMTDKIGPAGSPTGVGCTDPNGTCGTNVYHSCTLPLQITGRTPRNEFVCPEKNPADWPTIWVGDNGVPVPVTERGVYRRESGTWKNALLMDVPSRYRTIAANSSNSNCLVLNYVDPPRAAPAVSPTNAPTSPPHQGLLLSFLYRILNFFASLFQRDEK
jgi:hypothetical protein